MKKKLSVILIALLMAVVMAFSACTSKAPSNIDDNSTEVVEQYSITYNLNGGTNNSSNPKTYNSKTQSITFASPKKRANTFLGWATSPDGDVVYTDKIPYKGKGDITLYAKWLYSPTNTEYLEDVVVKDYPNAVFESIQEKIALDYSSMGFEVYATIVEGIYAVCYFYPDMANEYNQIPCGIVLINFPINAQVPIEIEVPWKEYSLISCFEADGLGQYQYKENGSLYLYDVQGSTAYIEYYDSVSEVDKAISNGTSRWDLDIYAWDYDSQDFLTIPFDLIPDYNPSGEWKLFGDYTSVALIESIQQLETIESATSIETFTGVFLSEDLAKYVEKCLLEGTQIYLNGVPFQTVIDLATENAAAGKLIVVELDGAIAVAEWPKPWTSEEQIDLIKEQVAQLQRQLILMGATVVVGCALAPFTAGASLEVSMLVGGLMGGGGELLQQIYVEGKSLSEIDAGSVILQGLLGSLTAGISHGVCSWAEKVAKTSRTMARVLPTLMRGVDIALDIGATVTYDLAKGYSWEQIRDDVAMTVVTNIVISTITAACFEAGTLISTPYGDKNIEEIAVGDLVYSYSNGSRVIGRVSQTYQRRAAIWSVHLSNGEIVYTTANHPFYANGYYIQTRFLQPNDRLLLVNGDYVEVEFVQQELYCADVYNFEVEDYHNYYADGCLVHNSCGPKVEELIYTDFENVPHKTNYNPANGDRLTDVYLISVVETDALDRQVSGRILEVYPDLKGKTYRQACVYVDGEYILKVGTTVNDFRTRYSSNNEFQRLYGLDIAEISPKYIVQQISQKEALMIESQLLKNFSLQSGYPLPGNSNYVEYTRSTRYDYVVDIDSIQWLINNPWEYLGYGN